MTTSEATATLALNLELPKVETSHTFERFENPDVEQMSTRAGKEQALAVVLDLLYRDRSALTRKRRLGGLTGEEAGYLRDLEEEIDRLEAEITPPPGDDLLARLEDLTRRVLDDETALRTSRE